MRGINDSLNKCSGMEDKLIEYLDGRAKPAERRAIENHIAGCEDCHARAEEFRLLWSAMDDVPSLEPSPAFDASLRARIAAEPVRRSFWSWLPSPRFAVATAALVAMSIWISVMPRVRNPQVPANPASVEADFRMIRDLPVLENYDVVSSFDALSELPNSPGNAAAGQESKVDR